MKSFLKKFNRQSYKIDSEEPISSGLSTSNALTLRKLMFNLCHTVYFVKRKAGQQMVFLFAQKKMLDFIAGLGIMNFGSAFEVRKKIFEVQSKGFFS